MPSVSLGPIASGLPKDLINKLIEAEREPLRQLEARKANEEDRLKLAQDLLGRINAVATGINDLTRFRQFRDLIATVGRPELMDVSVDKNIAEPGMYNIEVMQLAGRSSMLSSGMPDPNETQVGAGYFSYTLPSGEEREVYIDPDNSSLEGIAKLINSTKDLNLNAIVVDDGTLAESPYRLIVSHNKSGEINDAEFPTFYFLDGDEDFFLEDERPAQNSVIKVNGFNVEFEGNKVTTLFPGVTIDLKDSAPGKEFTLNIGEDIKSIKGKVVALVEKMNQVLRFAQDQNKLDKDSNTKNTMGGDITLQTMEYKLRNLVLNPQYTEFGALRMSDLGVTFQRDGLLKVDEGKLDSALNKNFQMVAQFFTGAEDDGTGFTSNLKLAVSQLTQQNGVVHSRAEGIKRRIQEIDKQIENKERVLARSEQNIKDKFARLESSMAALKGQQNYVQSALGGGGLLPNLGG